jgi:hypothetical protein
MTFQLILKNGQVSRKGREGTRKREVREGKEIRKDLPRQMMVLDVVHTQRYRQRFGGLLEYKQLLLLREKLLTSVVGC